jgi:hypothetical protein
MSSIITAIGCRWATASVTGRPVNGEGTRTGVGSGVGVGSAVGVGATVGVGVGVGRATATTDGAGERLGSAEAHPISATVAARAKARIRPAERLTGVSTGPGGTLE